LRIQQLRLVGMLLTETPVLSFQTIQVYLQRVPLGSQRFSGHS
jgi:hypothetical protein